MKTLVVERDGRITVHEVNKPRYNEYQALVKTIACGMCGTDIKLIHRTFKGFPESWAIPKPPGPAALPTAPLLRRCWTTIWTPWTPL